MISFTHVRGLKKPSGETESQGHLQNLHSTWWSQKETWHSARHRHQQTWLGYPKPMTKLFFNHKASQPPQVFWTRRSQTLPGGNSVGRPSKTDNCSRVHDILKLESDMNKFGWFRLLIALKTKTTQRIWRLKDLKDPQSVKTPWRSRVESGTFEHPQKSTRIATSQGSLLSRMDRPAVEGHTLYIAGFVSFVWWHGDFEWYPQKILKESRWLYYLNLGICTKLHFGSGAIYFQPPFATEILHHSGTSVTLLTDHWYLSHLATDP